MIRSLILTLLFASAAHAQDFAAISKKLPPLTQKESKITIPLSTSGPLSWRGIRDGNNVVGDVEGLKVSYSIEPSQPAGIAFVLPAKSLASIRSLHVVGRGGANTQLMLSLQTAEGATFAFPGIAVTKDSNFDITLAVDDLTFFAPQSKGPEPDHFDTADAVLLTIVDPSGFMSPRKRDVTWTLTAVEGERQ